MSCMLASWFLQWGQVCLVLWSSKEFIWAVGSLVILPMFFITILLVVVNNFKVMLMLRPFIFSQILRRALSWHAVFVSKCFKFQLLFFVDEALCNFYLQSFLVLFSFSSRVWKHYQSLWPTVVVWWIWVGLILVSISPSFPFSFCFLSRFAFSPRVASSLLLGNCILNTPYIWVTVIFRCWRTFFFFFSFNKNCSYCWHFLNSWACLFWPVQLGTARA